jgi:putative heme-binding domain-containing protein
MTGPDGALWVSDMYRMVIEHPEWIPEAWQERLDVYAGNDKGRIYRVYRKPTAAGGGQASAGRFAVPNLAAMTDVELVHELRSENGWRRDTAQMLLVQREQLDPEAIRRLGTEAMRGPAPLARLHALCTLDGRKTLTTSILTAALRDADPGVAREAARISADRLAESPQLLPELARLAGHDEVRVRLQVALALGTSRDAGAPRILARIAARDAGDRWVRAAVLSSALGKAEEVLAHLLREAPPSEERDELLAPLVATALGDDPQSGVARILNTITAPQPGGEQDWQLAALAACTDALTRRNISLRSLQKSDDPDVKGAVERAAALFDRARSLVKDDAAPVPRRALAASLLARAPDRAGDDLRLLARWLSPRVPTDLQAAAVDALAQSRAENVPELLLADWRGAGPQLRASILQALLSRPAWSRVLVERLREGTILPADLDAPARNRLLEHPDEGLRAAAAGLLGASTSADRQEVLQQYRTVHDLSGDAARGAAVFQKRCAACHKHHGIGTDVGASLAALQDKSTDSLLTALLDPNRAVEAKYTAYTLATKDGRVFSGMIVEETATHVTLAKSDGTRDVVLRVDIDEFTGSGKSFMPEGLEKDLSPQDVADVIAFIQSAEPPRK